MFELRPEEITKIRARAEAATPGPWVFDDDDHYFGEAIYPAAHASLPVVDRDYIVVALSYEEVGLDFRTPDDARFIAAARLDIPLLCSAVQQRDARIAELEERIAVATRRAREAERSRP